MSTLKLTDREAALWDRGGQDVGFIYPVLAVAQRWYPDVHSDAGDIYDHIREVVQALMAEDSKKYVAAVREVDGRGEAAELTPEGGLELGGRLGLIINSRSKKGEKGGPSGLL